jgi:hypothetical protein
MVGPVLGIMFARLKQVMQKESKDNNEIKKG